ncbi:MAG: fenitrothion hydrolase, partial [Actinomycetota bacterium]
FTLLSAVAIWYVQVFAIVAGHVAGVILAHDRSVAAFHSKVAVRTQYALLAVMVMFTATGLLILSGG